jgi:hypothetical protein
MANTLGALLVSLGLDAAEYTSGLSKAEYQAKRFCDDVSANFKKLAATIGVTLSVNAFKNLIEGAIDAADHLNDLSKSTGVAVETLGGLGFAAKQSGTDLDAVGKAVGKLNLQIAAATGGNEEAQQAFKLLGISVKELRESSPEQILFKIATAFASYEDGANKAALGNRYFGKSYQEIIPLLDEGGAKLQENIEYYKKYGGVTKEVAQQADEFNDTLTKLGLLSGAFGRELAAALLPSLQAVASTMVDAKEKSDGFKTAAQEVAGFLKLMAVGAIYTAAEFRALGTVIGARAAQLAGLAHLDFKAASFIGDELEADIKKQYAARDALVAAINSSQQAAGSAAGRPPGGKAPSLGGGAGKAKAEVDEFAKAMQRARELTAAAGDELAEAFSGEKILPAVKALDKLKESDVWRTLNAGQREALELSYASAASLEKEAEAWKKKREEQEKEIKVYQEIQDAQEKAQKAFTDTIGHYAEENDALKRQIGVLGEDDAARQKLAATLEYERLLKQGLAADDVKGIEILKQQYDERLKLIDAYNKTAEALRTTADYNRIFTDSFSDALVSVVEGTKSVSQAFKDMTRSIVHDLNEIAARNLAKALFGVEDSGGGGLAALIAKYGPALVGAFAGSPDYGSYATGPGAPQLGGPGGGLAGGTDYWRGGPTWVGEKGPEIVNLPRGSQVIPFDKAKRAGGSVNIVTNITVPGNTSRATADQIAQQTGIAVARAMRRNS